MPPAAPSRSTLRSYPTPEVTQADTGLGTLFERWALNRLLGRLRSDLDLRTAWRVRVTECQVSRV